MPITSSPEFPAIGDPAFNSKAFAWASALPAFGSAVDAAGATVAASEASAVSAAQVAQLARVAAVGASNYRGEWSTLSGAINIPASVSYNGAIYVLKASTAAVQTIVPTNATFWVSVNEFKRLPIFSAAAAVATAASNLEGIFNGLSFSVGTAGATRLSVANNLFMASGDTAGSTIGTSVDGRTWTLRTMTASLPWRISADGNSCLARAGASTTINTSTNSTTWTAAGALGAAASAAANPCGIGGVWLVYTATTNVQRSINFGASWVAMVLPASVGTNGGFFKVNGKFWYWSSGTSAYWSDTGETGSWTLTTLPVTPNGIAQSGDGSLAFAASGTGSQFYRSLTHQSYEAVVGAVTGTTGTSLHLVNGVYVSASATFGASFTVHSGVPTVRVSTNIATASSVSLGSLSALPGAAGFVVAIDPAISPTGTFV